MDAYRWKVIVGLCLAPMALGAFGCDRVASVTAPAGECVAGSSRVCPCSGPATGTNGTQACSEGQWSPCVCQQVAALTMADVERLLSGRSLVDGSWRFDPRERRELSDIRVTYFNMTMSATVHVRSFDINGGAEYAGRVALRGEWTGSRWTLREEPQNVDFARQ